MTIPHDKNLEASVIGGILLDNEYIPNVTAVLKNPDCFYVPENQAVYRAILELSETHKNIDILLVTTKLRENRTLDLVGGAYAVSKYTSNVVHGGNAERHAYKLYELWMMRQMIRIGNAIASNAQEPHYDAFELLEWSIKELQSIDYVSGGQTKSIASLVDNVIEDSINVITSGKKTGITTGHENVDKYFVKQVADLGIIAARPAMGKTAYMLSCAVNSARQGNPVAIFSLEMGDKRLAMRVMSSETYMPLEKLVKNSLDTQDIEILKKDTINLKGLPIYIDETPNLTVYDIQMRVRKLVYEYGIKEVYIDYLQLMTGKGQNREQEIAGITRGLKLMAKSEKVAVTALSQLSRKVEERVDKMPNLGDLRESGAIEQDADWVMFLMRPEYYGLQDEQGYYQEQKFEGNTLMAEGLLIAECAKYRDGETFIAPLRCNLSVMQISGYRFGSGLENNMDF